MSELRSTVDALRSETLAELPDARVEEDFAELHRAVEQLEVERLRRLAEIERRGLHERDGFLSAAAWLVSRFKVAWGVAREHVRIARALDHVPQTRRALEEGEVSMSAIRVLVAVRDASADAFERCEPQLVEAARIHSVSDVHRVAAFWREAVEREQALDGGDRLRARRQLHASVSLLGMMRVDGGRPDARTAPGRRARRDLPPVARPGRAADGGRRTPTRHGDGGCGCARVPPRSRRAGSRRTRRCRCCAGARLRRVRHAGRDDRAFRAARRRSSDTGRPALDAPGRDRSRSPVSVPRLPPSAYLVRRSPRGALGRRRADRAGEPVAALPPPPQDGALGTLPPGALETAVPCSGDTMAPPSSRERLHSPGAPPTSRRRWTPCLPLGR